MKISLLPSIYSLQFYDQFYREITITQQYFLSLSKINIHEKF